MTWGIALLLGAVVAAGAVRANEPVLRGAVRDGAGRPAVGARVTARRLGGTASVSVATDAAGRYAFGRLLPGRYRVQAEHARGAAARDSVAVGAASPAPGVDLTLRDGAADPARERPMAPSSAYLQLLPEGAEKRKFILDCTGCHQLDAQVAAPNGTARGEADWAQRVTQMLSFSGAHTGFPVIAADRDAGRTARWLAAHLTDSALTRAAAAAGARRTTLAGDAARAVITEYDMPERGDLPHDLQVDARGRVVITGMFSHRMYVLHPDSGTFEEVPIPVPNANPRAVELDRAGNWWVLLGTPKRVARYDIVERRWSDYPIGMYPHSVALDSGGGVWFNGHFTRAPEQIGRLDAASGSPTTFDVPPHPTMAEQAGGPIPYELRAGRDGTIWGSELQGNRIFSFTPSAGRFAVYDLPTAHAGPRRLDVAADGTVWVPAYAANALMRFDPRTSRWRSWPLPAADMVPYVARVDARTGAVWVGTSAGDALLRFDPRTERFAVFALPSRGAMIRHLSIDPRTGDVWAAYGASPGRIPARVARLELR